jgi:hypothetical protein
MSSITISATQSSVSTKLSFSVTGVSGTTGFGNVTIPKSAIAYGTTPTVYIDNQSALSQGYTQDANNYYVWYTTHFSRPEVSIVFTETSFSPTVTTSHNPNPLQSLPPEAIYYIVISTVLVEISAVLLFLRKRGNSKS